MVGFLFLVIVAAASVSTSVTAFSVTSSSSFITIHGHLPPGHNINNNCRRRHCNLALELFHTTHEDCETNNKSSSNDDDDVSSVSSISSNEHSRRSMIATTFTTLLTISSSSCASASTDDEEKIYVKGVATLQSGITINNDNDTNNPNKNNAALYVTARPNKADNVPRAILDGSNGRPPPVLSARYPNPTFPYEFRLTSQNYTPEGASSSIIEEGNNDNNAVWWEDEDLIISARLDTDGIAATRDPTDLVGRGLYIKKKMMMMDDNENDNNVVSIELQGRGLFGKSVTAKK